jgi:hypothetical protein
MIAPLLPRKSRDVKRVDDRRVISAILGFSLGRAVVRPAGI